MKDYPQIAKTLEFVRHQGSIVAAAIAFYTCLPVPMSWTLEFRGIARFAPLIGVAIGAIVGLLDAWLQLLEMPVLTRSALVVICWIWITGGLHLDGVMDMADGLAVSDPKRRLEVMADSLTGAFGVMAAIAVVLLKTAALSELSEYRGLAIMAAAGWGRWGQLVAIVRYPYIKATGKGAIHKEEIYRPIDLLPGFLLLLSLSLVQLMVDPSHWILAIGMAMGGSAIAILKGAWINHKIGGHTGDTYGAVVEWTEALLLCVLTSL
ncbi:MULTISPECIES: adenosylcobinamide-GDP ribazoletransferase [Planktothricoides]|uniref:Adenosylcobinamide-GDP ribazoletransferase n=2 Tax=Planktothricoides raciborskii TaxID=132608 RepID=A0AAU8JFW0_9CYAN|nr:MULTISPECIES: adenosylcobinamide-GDP ribazoletransferase [Planktothricoides]KOR35463.1 cobalamin synthase [Planktothricoides sp. SR001]MBD2545163.1 adenosylcobinamide-GDP ribazoletransferase [Planktothricoides raciborskii FACHB-1370]MBD2583308.1 adenosylcobinamide-GDP ribazoletransferase [Planktothricoides raciborskii FACHB-1261]